MTTKTVSRAQQKYDKAKILADLTHAQQLVLAAMERHEDDLVRWKETIVAKFAEAVEQYQEGYGWYNKSFEPPYRPDACRDWRIQRINRSILRIQALADDVVSLRADDSVFDDIALGACL